MKLTEPPPRLGDLLDHRRRSIFDPGPAIERLDRELQHVEILEEVVHEEGRIFPMVTKAYMPAMRVERRPDGSLPPVLVVRFPERVDAEEWSKRCRAWQRPPSPIE
jgi:anti-sigma regulatory factor (Ser/Thr protein kinase)